MQSRRVTGTMLIESARRPDRAPVVNFEKDEQIDYSLGVFTTEDFLPRKCCFCIMEIYISGMTPRLVVPRVWRQCIAAAAYNIILIRSRDSRLCCCGYNGSVANERRCAFGVLMPDAHCPVIHAQNSEA